MGKTFGDNGGCLRKDQVSNSIAWNCKMGREEAHKGLPLVFQAVKEVAGKLHFQTFKVLLI